MKILSLLLCVLLIGSVFAGCGGSDTSSQAPEQSPAEAPAESPAASPAETPAAEPAGEEVTLDFAQWWEPELPSGSFRALMDKFEAENPGIKINLLSAPYDNTRELAISGAATGTLSDIVGLDGSWVYDFAKQGAIANLTDMMTTAGYDDSELAAQIKYQGNTYMIPVVNFVYPLFVNMDILEAAGYTEMPKTHSEFVEMAKKMAATGENVAGYCITLNLENPGIQNDVCSWIWASGGKFIKDGQPDLAGNEDVKIVMEMMKGLYDAGVLTPGAAAMKEQDKVEEFVNGRIGMIENTLAHLTMIKERNADLNYDICQLPVKDGYTGECGFQYATWGIGASASSKNPEAAWTFVSFMMRQDTNKELAALANAFPGNKTSTPDFTNTDPKFEKAFTEIYQKTYVENEFTGMPQANELQRTLAMQFQLYLDGEKTVDQMLTDAQAEWEQIIASAA